MPAADRFWSKAKADQNGCWIWQSTTLRGYGQIALSRNGSKRQRRVWAHRFAWELTNGPIPAGQVICHRCDVRRCINPAHLFLGTQLDNVADQIAKGRLTFGRKPLPPSPFLQNIAKNKARQTKARSADLYLRDGVSESFGRNRHASQDAPVMSGHATEQR